MQSLNPYDLKGLALRFREIAPREKYVRERELWVACIIAVLEETVPKELRGRFVHDCGCVQGDIEDISALSSDWQSGAWDLAKEQIDREDARSRVVHDCTPASLKEADRKVVEKTHPELLRVDNESDAQYAKRRGIVFPSPVLDLYEPDHETHYRCTRCGRMHRRGVACDAEDQALEPADPKELQNDGEPIKDAALPDLGDHAGSENLRKESE